MNDLATAKRAQEKHLRSVRFSIRDIHEFIIGLVAWQEQWDLVCVCIMSIDWSFSHVPRRLVASEDLCKGSQLAM